jgi:hypothetical protein
MRAYLLIVSIYVYIDMNDDESMLPTTGSETVESPLRLLEDILHNRIMQKKDEIHKTTQSIADTDRIWTEIETLRWVLSQSLSIRKRLGHK